MELNSWNFNKEKSLMKYVVEFNAKLTLEPIKEEFTKKLAFLRSLYSWACRLVFQRRDTPKTWENLMKLM
jgi:hypothetical protein